MTTASIETHLAAKQRGATAGATDLGVPMLGIRKDVAADLAGADGKYTVPQFDTTGNLRVAATGGGDASAANQGTEIAALQSIDGHVDGLEAAIGTPGDAPASDDTSSFSIIALIKRGLARWTTLLAAIPAALTGLGNFKVAVSEAIAAGTNEIGKTNIKHFNIVGSTLTRPANVTPYSANDSISDNATAASVTANTVTISDTNDDPVNLLEVLLDSTDTGFGAVAVSVRLHVFNSDPTANSGVGGGDNAAWSQKRAGWVGSFSGAMTLFSDGSRGVLIPDGPSVKIANVESGGKRLWWQLQVLGAATPSAISTAFTPRFKGYQGRA